LHAIDVSELGVFLVRVVMCGDAMLVVVLLRVVQQDGGWRDTCPFRCGTREKPHHNTAY
jgi:hypothetical protein